MATRAEGESLVARVVRDLSALSLQYEEGAYLGAEDDLLARFGVSRPTLRQAAKIAESECMISVRRGIRGGFYAMRPNVDDSIRALNRYLRLRGVTLRDLFVTKSIPVDAASLAAQCDDVVLRQRLATLLGEVHTCVTAHALMEFDTRFVGLLATMSGNPVIEVMIAMSYSFGWGEQGVHPYTAHEQQSVARKHLSAIGQAVLDHDGELAGFLMRRRVDVIGEWLQRVDESPFRPIDQS